MKEIRYFFRVVLGSICLAVILNGCVSVPNSPVSRFYMLQSEEGNKTAKKIDSVSGTLIGIGPVQIPEYLDRPQIVTKNQDNTLNFAEFDRWGESIGLAVERTIREDLSQILPQTQLTIYPWNPSIPVKYQVMVEVVQLDSILNKDLIFIVQWTVMDVQSMKKIIMKRSEFRQPIVPQNYAGLAETLSLACESLSREIAEAFVVYSKDVAPK